MTSLSLPDNSNKTYSPVTSPHHPFHTTVWLCPPLTSLSHPYNNSTLSPHWHHYLIHTTIQLCPPLTSQSLPYNSNRTYPPVTWWHHYPIHATAIGLSPQWHHDDITIPSVQQQYHVFPSDMTTSVSPLSLPYNNSILSPSDIAVTSLSLPYNSNTTYPPVTWWHHYPIHATAIWLSPQWHHDDITIPFIQQQYNSTPHWHDDITILFIQQHYNYPPVTSLSHWYMMTPLYHYPIHTTAIQLYPPSDTMTSLSHSYNSNTTLSPSDIMQDDSSPSDITMTSLSHPYNN